MSRRPLMAALLFAALVARAALAAGNPAENLPRGVTYKTSVEGIHEYSLENGLRVLLFPDPSQQTATVNITYLVGSRHEGYGETGMAHLLEHLLFKGSTNHTNIPDELTSHGSRPNGTTWFDRTNYFETFSSTQENLVWALDLEADRMVASFVAQKDLDSEMSVVRNEFERGENDPAAVLEERVYSTAYLWHNYGKSTIGARSDIEGVPIDRLKAFYKTWYRPDNTVLVVGGSFDPARTLDLIQARFGPLTNPRTPLPMVYTREPAQDGERSVTLRRVGDVQVAAVAYHIPAGSHPDYPALEVLAEILGDTPAGRLHKTLVETKRATRISGRADLFHDSALFFLTAEVRKGLPLEAVQEEMTRIAEGLGGEPASAEEVERAKSLLLRRWETAIRSSSRAAIDLSEWSAMGDWRLMFLYRDRLKEVTSQDVARVAGLYLKSTNRTTGLYIPTEAPVRVEIPENPDVKTLVDGYRGGEAMATGEDFDPSHANIESRVVRFSLPSGTKVSLLAKKTRGETVNVQVQLHSGQESTLKNMARIGDLLGDMLMRGTTTKTRQDIRDEIDRLKIRFGVRGGASGASGTIEATRATLTDALRLMADVLMNPVFQAGEFDQLKEETLARFEESKADPQTLSSIAMARHMSPWPKDDVRYTSTLDERIERTKAATLDQLRTFHQAFYGASAGEIAITGDFDVDQVRGLLTELFGNWKSREAYVRLAPYKEARPAILESIETPDKESASFTAQHRVLMRDDNPDFPAMVLGNFMTGSGFLNSRLATRIRQKEGLSYGVGSRFWADSWAEAESFGAFAIYAPQNDARLLNAFNEEIKLILDKGFTEEEVAEAKSGWLQREKVSRSTDATLAAQLAAADERGRTLMWDATIEQKVAGLTPAVIQAAFKRHIDPKAISIVRAGDFARVKRKEKDSSEKVD